MTDHNMIDGWHRQAFVMNIGCSNANGKRNPTAIGHQVAFDT
jgi:hypothetical protein